MKKMTALWTMLNLIFLVVFNVTFFMTGGSYHKTSAWISYGFIHFAYLILLLAPYLIRRGQSSRIFGFSIYLISTVYFLVEFITGVAFILLSPDGYTTALLVQLVLAGLYGIVLFAHMIANEHTAESEEKRQSQVSYIKKSSAELQGVLESIVDKEVKKKIERVYNELNSSPIKSHPNLELQESQILILISDLADSVSSGCKDKTISLADLLHTAINERNRHLKALQSAS